MQGSPSHERSHPSTSIHSISPHWAHSDHTVVMSSVDSCKDSQLPPLPSFQTPDVQCRPDHATFYSGILNNSVPHVWPLLSFLRTKPAMMCSLVLILTLFPTVLPFIAFGLAMLASLPVFS